MSLHLSALEARTMPSPAPYLNFDLLITRAGDRYRALVVDAPGGDADIFFDLPPSLPGFQDLLALTGPRRGLHEEPAQTIPAASLDDVGRLLYDAIFQGEVRDVLVVSQREAADNAAGLRLRFHEDAAELATLPWELLYDVSQERFLALSESLPIVRYLSLPRPRPALVTEPPLRILAVLASPNGLDALNLEGEWQVLSEALAPLVDDGKVVLERLASPTPSALQHRLLGDPVHVLHFVGHGVFDEESRQGMLVLADERNQPKLMGARELATLLANHTSLRLLYLNACEGALGDNANVFAGLAQRLVQAGAPAAIAMQAEISDKAGIDLARTFYTALATGRPVDAALTQARVTLAMNSSSEWATPVLFSRAPDNRLFDIRDVLPTPECPYPGMKPFTEAQQEYFFGRDKEIDDAVNRLARHPFLTVVGPSGSGKSSLVYAGILPALRASRRFDPGPWTVHTLRPSDARTADGKAAPMQALSQLGDLSTQLPVTSHQSPILLFIDQFEETFTLADAAEARTFLNAVHALIGQPNLYILLTVRADFYAEMMAMDELWNDVQARRLELTPLGEDELWAAIADARGEAGVLPLVQETLVRLWDKVEGRQLKRSAYRQMADGGRSGIQVAINDHANDIYHTLPAEDRSTARRIFLRLIQFGEGRADTRRQQTVAELRAGDDDPIRFDETLRALVDGRLLTTGGEEGDPNRRVDISHEALIGGWALLQQWIGEKRVAESTRRRLEDKVTEWLRLDKSGGLLDEYEMLEVEAWLASDYSAELGYQQELIDLKDASSIALASAEAEKAEAEQTRRRAQIFGGGLVLVALAIALVGWFWWQAITAESTAIVTAAEVERLARGIRADQLTTNALKVVEDDPDLGLLIAIEGIRLQQDLNEPVTGSAYNNIRQLLTTYFDAGLSMVSPHKANTVGGVAFDAEGRWMVTADTQGRVVLSDLEKLQPSYRFLKQEGPPITSLTFGPSNSYFLAGYQTDGYTLLWNLTKAGDTPFLLPQARYPFVFSIDNLWLATASDTDSTLIWNLAKPEATPTVLAGAGKPITAVSFSQERLVTVTPDRRALIWDSGSLNEPIRTITKVSFPLSLSPDTKWFATTIDRTEVALWNLDHPDNGPVVTKKLQNDVIDLEFAPDNQRLLVVLANQSIEIWSLSPSIETVASFQGVLPPVAFSQDGEWFAASAGESQVQIVNLTVPDAIPVEINGISNAMALTFSTSGNFLVTTEVDQTVRLHTWQASDIIETGCRLVKRNLSAREWERFLPGIEKRPTCPAAPVPEDRPEYFDGISVWSHRAWFADRARTMDPVSVLGHAETYEVEIEAVDGTFGDEYWRIIGLYHLISEENSGRHHVFVDIIDEAGNRIENPNVYLQFGWQGQAVGESPMLVAFDKPSSETAANIPLWRNMNIWLSIADSERESERVSNLHTEWPDADDAGNSVFHHSFYIVFQLTRK
jgi:WD40 repeat protein/CHAT domain-containing protein